MWLNLKILETNWVKGASLKKLCTCYATFMTFLKGPNYCIKEQILDFQGLRVRGRYNYKGIAQVSVLGWCNHYISRLYWWLVAPIYTCMYYLCVCVCMLKLIELCAHAHIYKHIHKSWLFSMILFLSVFYSTS